jgi:6-phosphofructokinase
MKKIGILTSGGDCGGLNGVVKGAAQMANSLGITPYVIPNGYAGLYNLVDFDKLTLAQMSNPFEWLEADAHGGILKRSSSNRTVWEGTLKYYANLCARSFKSSGRLSGKTAS